MGAPVLAPAAAVVGGLKISELIKDGLDALLGFEPGRAWLQETLEKVIPGATSSYTAFQLETRADFMIRLVTALLEAEQRINPKLAQLAALGLEDYFGVPVPAAALVGRGGGMTRGQALEPLSAALLGALFGSFGSAGQGSPDAGYASMLRLVDNSLFVAVGGWLRSNLGLGIITKDLPDWGDLHHIVATSMGLGRVTARAMRPIVDGLILEPARQKLNSTYLNSLPTEGQAVRLLHRGVIQQEEFFEIMGRHGWNRTLAAETILSSSTLPSRADLRALLEQGLATPATVTDYLVAQGYPPSVADQLVQVIQNDRVRGLRQELAVLARQMFVAREIEEGEARGIITRAGYTEDEAALLVAVAQLERSRPKRLTLATMDEMFNRGIVELASLSAFYALEGYAPPDVALLEERAVQVKLEYEARVGARKVRPPAEEPGALPHAEALEANRLGVITDAQLLAVLQSQGVKGSALETELALAAKRRAAYLDAIARKLPPSKGLAEPAGSIEQAYVRNLVTDQELTAFYVARGFSGDPLRILLQLRAVQRAEFIARQVKAAAKAAGGGTKPLA